ncbi:MAG: EthD domain-containing protein [Pseudomonadota bacterium]
MIKVLSMFRRKPGMSVDDFQAYWLGPHAESASRLPGVKRYVQNHTLLSAYKKLEPIYDGLAELWFEDSAALKALVGTPELDSNYEDHKAFMDPDSYVEFITEDIVIKDEPFKAPGVKNVEVVKRKKGMDPAEFHKYWQEVHGPLGASIDQLRRYVQSHTRMGAYKDGNEPPLDGVALGWFENTDEMRASARSEQYAVTRDDEQNFLEIPLDFFIANEHVIIEG